MKKILLVTNICEIGGAENHIFLLAKELARSGLYQVSLAFLKVKNQKIKKELIRNGIQVFDLNCPTKKSIKPFFRLSKLIKEGSYETVHSHLTYCDWLVAGIHRGWPHFKAVRTIHNCETLFKFWPIQLFNFIFINSQFEKTICISKAVQKDVQKYLKVPPAKTKVIYYGYPVTKIADRPKTKKSTKKTAKLNVLFLARLVPQKNHSLVFKALAQLNSAHLKVVLAGSGSPKYEKKLKGQVKQLQIKDQVEFAGFQPNPAKLIGACDLLILPSRWEGFGLVLLEAMAQAKAIIGSNIAPINEVVVDGKTGWLFKTNTAQALADTFREALENSDRISKMGLNGYKRLKQEFSVEKMVRETIKIL
jgi:glycosyltransferase involved in cell wall biosynthesis